MMPTRRIWEVGEKGVQCLLTCTRIKPPFVWLLPRGSKTWVNKVAINGWGNKVIN